MFVDMGKSMAPQGGYQETSVTPDEPDILDANYALQGHAADVWRRARRVRRLMDVLFSLRAKQLI